jgi:serine/threonine protein phosphatase 1
MVGVMSASNFFHRFLSRSLGTLPAPLAVEEPAPIPAPKEPVCLLGDLHGCAKLLERFLRLRQRYFPEHRIVALGDAIDRGENSAEALQLLHAETNRGAVCLMGNHEEMLIEFLDDPADQGRRWLVHGGLDTLASFGLRGLPSDARAREATRDALRERIGGEIEAWLRALPPLWRSGNLVAAHAALDPDLPPEIQDRRHLVWGHRSFPARSRRDGICVAYGHTLVDRAHMRAGRLALDTGAYATGKLSYALIDPAAAESERVTFAVVPS